ncbi:hypothetical protein [Phytohabitans aurantiacus]|uniref:Uncharacterized protein n=1 Tax=Phytohabitans aurantiacus TaxID=3016789 RepID=A0ABQ5R5K3_9ACTN|nr:hypothetical protein [Phytohabitans aurantiacus]GLI01980.1 hypothetical protein Pa4123_72570 [Phytohabitans aurantiacus]
MPATGRHFPALPATTREDVPGAMPAARPLELRVTIGPAGRDITRAMPASRRHSSLPATPGQNVTSSVPPARRHDLPGPAPATRPVELRVTTTRTTTGHDVAGPMPTPRPVTTARAITHHIASAMPPARAISTARTTATHHIASATAATRPISTARAITRHIASATATARAIRAAQHIAGGKPATRAAVPWGVAAAGARVVRGRRGARPRHVLLDRRHFVTAATEPASRTRALARDRAFGGCATTGTSGATSRRQRRRNLRGVAGKWHLGSVARERHHPLDRSSDRRTDRASLRRNRTARRSPPTRRRLDRQPADPGERSLWTRPRR